MFIFREEWEWLLKHALPSGVDSEGVDDSEIDSSGLEPFVHSLRSAVTTLLTRLNIPLYRVISCQVLMRICPQHTPLRLSVDRHNLALKLHFCTFLGSVLL